MLDLVPIHVSAIVIAAAFAVLTLVALVVTVRDRSLSAGMQVFWILLLLLVPVVGLLVWVAYWLARRSKAGSTVATAGEDTRRL
jgi:H+/Cl- antiporter ClcA